ncbi:PolC-type DNA polymerase III [Oscillibacter sp.]|uniref:PolC-type DNA polymerase III n=1 Tax=Oscillibacter sp. TaxID=1945593 RepID=UPI00257F6B13|nr:PolC-type DNA polymerase III [Oscillibacter sp.]
MNGACIDQAGMSLALRLTTRAELGDAELEELKHLLMGVYGFRQVTTEVTCKAPSSQAAAAGSRPAASVPAAPSGSKGEKQAAGKVLMGKPIRIQPVPMKILDLKMGNATVAGKVFAFECRETRRPGMWRLSFDMTDYTNSVTVQKNLTEKEAQGLESAIKPGMWLCVQGKMEPTWDGKDIQLNPTTSSWRSTLSGRIPPRSVELHLHTKMSNMDALTDTKEVVQQAIRWGHPAIAITDHGVAQSFPDAWHAAGDKIKILYGVEGYFVNNIDDRVVVHGPQDCSLDGEFVCFDIETTGLKVDREAITEIGAVVLKNGEITDRFQTFVNPNRRLTPEIIGLTGITDDMLKDAPQLKEALAEFLKFVDGRPLAAHNAEFDIGFIRAGCRKVGLDFQPTYVDSLILAQNLLPDLGKYKLDIVADRLELPNFNHHRASDDAATVGYMLIPFWKMLHERGIHTLQAVNREMEKLRPLGSKTNRFPKHIILIARNKVGLKNLYQMISASNLKYFKRVPTIPKSLLLEHREGIIVGSACEAGELFRAVADHKDWEELKRIASFYDYLEIQPLCNNAFMLRNGDVQSEEELREFNRTIVRLGEELGKPVCATGDVHFREPEDEVYRHILLASKKFPDANAPLPIYFKTTDEMLEEFAYLGKEKAYEVVVTNTQAIADQVETFPLLPEELFPPRLENSEEELNSLVWNKVHELYGEDPPKLIVDRLNVELGGILGKYDVVYMSAQKLVQRSLENGYLVGSRGSVGSSLVAYMSGITEVNSLRPHYRCPNCKHAEFIQDGSYGCGADMPDKICPVCGTEYIKDGFDIPFETFLGFGGGKVPDIDLNFSGEYQARAHRHAIEMFGETRCSGPVPSVHWRRRPLTAS